MPFEMHWSDWRPFPDPEDGDMLIAPFGAGCYEVRRIGSGQLVLFGIGGHVANRMSSLLPKPHGTGTRNNSAKREYCLKHLTDIEYRTMAAPSKKDAAERENELKKSKASYVFDT